MRATVEPAEVFRVVYTDHPDPFQILGAHAIQQNGQRGVAVRAFLPDASEAFVIEHEGSSEIRHRMTLLHPYGFFETFLPDRIFPLSYELERLDEFGQRERFLDSYAFQPTLTSFDLHLFGQGRHYRIYEKLGAHTTEVNGVGGVRFAVWAPAARSVSVIGSFNGWDRRKHPMRRMDAGVWEIFVPGIGTGELYKFQIKTHQDYVLDKTDPFAFRTQVAPQTASIVHELGQYEWRDQAWMERRKTFQARTQPMSIYEVHLASWRRAPGPQNGEDRPLTYLELRDTLVPYVKEMGYTHVELLPVMEHPFGGSWGYQVTGYYAPTSRLGRPEELMALIDAFHEAGIGVILDWVPAHFPKDIHSLGRFDGTAVYEHLDPRLGEHQDWGTYIFNYGRSEVRNFLIGSALFWLEHYHADGLRVDAISSMIYLNYSRRPGQWLPNKFGGTENLEAVSFLQELNDVVREYHPGVFVSAEEATAWPGVSRPTHLGGLGFDHKWNMGWMHDSLSYLALDPIFRSFQHGKLTFSIWYAFNEAFILPLSHDEVVHLKKSIVSKMSGDMWRKFATTRLLYGYQYAHPGKPLLFMGGEIGQWREWHHDRSLDWHLLRHPMHSGLQRFVQDLNQLYRSEPALWELDHTSDGFEWVDMADNQRSIIAFLRKGNRADEQVLFVFNFTPVPRHDYRLGVDLPGFYEERLNSDASVYGGSNLGNLGGVHADPISWHGRPWSLRLVLPPLGVLMLKRQVPPSLDEAPKPNPEPLLPSLSAASPGKDPGPGEKRAPQANGTPGANSTPAASAAPTGEDSPS